SGLALPDRFSRGHPAVEPPVLPVVASSVDPAVLSAAPARAAASSHQRRRSHSTKARRSRLMPSLLAGRVPASAVANRRMAARPGAGRRKADLLPATPVARMAGLHPGCWAGQQEDCSEALSAALQAARAQAARAQAA